MKSVLHKEHRQALGRFLGARDHAVGTEALIAQRAEAHEAELMGQAQKLREAMQGASGHAARRLEDAYLTVSSRLAMVRRARALAKHTLTKWRGKDA